MFEKRYKSHHDVKDVINKLTKKSIVTPFTFNKLLNEEPENKEAGIYVHTPYCDKICSFCNMNRKQVSNNLDDYVEYLCKEFEKYGSKKYVQGKEITTIFFGGGTPTIYKEYQLEKILSTLTNSFNISSNCEFTFETTLHNLTLKKLAIMEKYGVNRLSIGIQTFSDRGRKLLNRTYEQKEIIKRIKELTGKDFKFYQADIRDEEAMTKVFAENKIDAVIHFAGLKSVPQSIKEPLNYYDNNIAGTVCLCRVMDKAGCKKLVFSSSATVYGSKNPSPLREDMPTGGTTNPYGTTKYFIEQILQDLCVSDSEWGVSILRYFNPIGAHKSGRIGEDPNGIPGNLMPYITQVAIGKLECLNVCGNDYPTPDGTGVRDYIHVVDLALGHIKALDRLLKVKGCEVYNLGTGKGYSVLDVVKAFEKASIYRPSALSGLV